jgi:hypothetical protein
MALSVTILATACGGGGTSLNAAPQTSSPPPTTSANHAPTISGQPTASVRVGEAYSFTPTAADSDGDTLTFNVSNKPAWLAFNASTGKLSGTPAAGDVGNFAGIALSVSDGKASAALSSFSLDVTQIATGAVTLNWAPPTANADGSTLTDLAGYKVLYGRSEGTLDQSVSFTNPSLSTAVVSNLSPGTWFFVIVSVNSKGTESVPTNTASATM